MKAGRVIIYVQLLMKVKNLIKPVTGCMAGMLLPTDVKILSDHVIPRSTT